MIKIVKPVLAVPLGKPIEGTGTLQLEGKLPSPQQITTNLNTIASLTMTILTITAGLAFIVYFILGAFKWITSGGDQGKTEEAKKQLTQAAIGIIVVVVSYFVIDIIGKVLGFKILSPGSTLNNILP